MKYMTSFIFSILFAGVVTGHASEEMQFLSCEKTYIDPSQIYVGQEGIFINLKNNWIQTNGIHTDRQGLYFAEVRADERLSIFSWTCPHCGRENGILDSYCKNKDCSSRKKKKA